MTESEHYAIFQSECDGDDWFATPYALPSNWRSLSHQEVMEHIFQQEIEDPSDQGEREYWERHQKENLLIVDAKTASIINTVLDSAACSDSSVTRANWTAVCIATEHQVAVLKYLPVF